jgi:hypothetical protein
VPGVRGAVRVLLTLLLAAGSAGYLRAESGGTLADRGAQRGLITSAAAASTALVNVEGTVGSDARAPAPPAASTSPSPSAAAAITTTANLQATTTATAAPPPAPVVTVTVSVIHDGQTTPVTTTATTVGTMLTAAGIPVHSLDKVIPALTTPLTGGTTIRIVRVTQTISTKDITITFRQTTKNSTTVELGSTETAQSGVNGTTEKDYRTTYDDGKAVGTVLAATRVIVAERDQVTLIGTGQPVFVSHGGSATGASSWYGSSGLTAASPSLPFGTVVHVIDLANGRTINVRIDDRGPSTGGGRILDLSPLAFSQLASLGSGIVPVKIEW